MMINENTKKLIETVSTKNFIEYLNATNWRLYNTSRKDIKIYQIYMENKLYQINIPLNEDFIDYYEDIYNALLVLSNVENDSLESLISKITYKT